MLSVFLAQVPPWVQFDSGAAMVGGIAGLVGTALLTAGRWLSAHYQLRVRLHSSDDGIRLLVRLIPRQTVSGSRSNGGL